MDSRDDPFDSTRGWFHSSTVEYGPEVLGSDLQFLKYTGQQFHYWDLGNNLVLASAVRLGLGAGLGGDDLSVEVFTTGGGNTVRGYSQDSLGPVDPIFGVRVLPPDSTGESRVSIFPSGGNASLVLNQELRFPLYRIVRGVGFVDAGNVFPTIGDLSFSDLKVGVGLGVRVDTPFGLFRFDFATALSDTDFSRSSDQPYRPRTLRIRDWTSDASGARGASRRNLSKRIAIWSVRSRREYDSPA